MSLPRISWLRMHKGDLAEGYIVSPGPLEWLTDLMHDAGGFKREVGAMGASYAPLGWAEIAAWIAGSGQNDIAPFWRRQVMALSGHYAQQIEASFEMTCPAPFDPGKDGG